MAMKRMKLFRLALATAVAMPLLCLSPADSPDPGQFFKTLSAHDPAQPYPSYDRLLQVVDQIQAMAETTLTAALPDLFAALQSPDDAIAVDAAFALTAVAGRPDSNELLRSHLSEINALLGRSDRRLKATVPTVFLRMQPAPREAVPRLANFLTRNDQSSDAKPDAVFALIKLAPNDPAAIAAIRHFIGLPLDRQTRIDTINALGSSHLTDGGLLDLLARQLADPDQNVRLAAIQTMNRIGRPAVQHASAALTRLANDPAESLQIRQQAQHALALMPQ